MADRKPISRMNKAELEKLAKKEGVEVAEGASKDDVYEAIRSSRAGAEKPDGEGKAKTPLTVDSDAPEDAPESEVPPTSGPEDIQSSAATGGEGSVDPETGETLPRNEPYTGDVVPAAETLADGGPEPPQPSGSDEGGVRPLDQTSAPGFKTEGEVAAAKAEAKANAKAAKQREKDRLAESEPDVSTGIEVGFPRSLNTQLTITGRGFPAGKPVRVAISGGSRFPTGEQATTLKANTDGVVQVSIFPVAGEHSVTMSTDGASASADFKVADPQSR